MAQWVEKYRPERLDDIVGQEKIVAVIKSFLEQEDQGIHELPHFMFAGMPGVGKTATAVAFARELYGENWKGHFMERNASDERGIDTIREDIKGIAKQQSLDVGTYRVIFLDECDRLTDQAQAALRRVMERYSDTTKFILSCNHPSKLLDAIRERCTEFRFSPVDEDVLYGHLVDICNREDVDYEESALKLLAKKSRGSVRKSLQALQAISSVKKVTDDWVEHQLGAVTDNEIARLYQMTRTTKAVDVRMKGVDEAIIKMYREGKTAQEILEVLFSFISREHPERVRALVRIGDIDANISQGANPLLQLRCFMAWLVKRKDEG